ncbi:MAG: hypothetical protein AAF447_20040 [Myxococcota bacterium]
MTLELSIQLDEPRRRYDAGDEVIGTVHARGVSGEALQLALDWVTEGRGDPEQHEVASQPLREPTPDGGRLAYRFHLRMPDEPRGYAGALFRLGYRLRAVATHREREEAVVTLPLETPTRPPPVVLDAVARGSTGLDKGCLGCSSLLMLQPLAWVLSGGDFASLGGGLFCFLACLGALGVSLFLGTVLAEQRIGRVRIDLTPPALGTGYREAVAESALRCRVRFRARVPTPPTVRATLVVRESTRQGDGSTTRTLRHVLFESAATLDAVRAGDHEGLLSLPPPRSAPPAFSVGHTSVSWEVRVDIDIPDWPDWTQTIALPARVSA